MSRILIIVFFSLLLVDLPFAQVVKSCKVICISNLYSQYRVYDLLDEKGDSLYAFSYCGVTNYKINKMTKVQENETYDLLLLELPVGFKLQLRPYEDRIVFKIDGREISKGNSLLSKCYLILNAQCESIDELILPVKQE